VERAHALEKLAAKATASLRNCTRSVSTTYRLMTCCARALQAAWPSLGLRRAPVFRGDRLHGFTPASATFNDTRVCYRQQDADLRATLTACNPLGSRRLQASRRCTGLPMPATRVQVVNCMTARAWLLSVRCSYCICCALHGNRPGRMRAYSAARHICHPAKCHEPERRLLFCRLLTSACMLLSRVHDCSAAGCTTLRRPL
jgi:hypothetical protein